MESKVTTDDNIKAIIEYKNAGKPISLRNKIALDNERLIWGALHQYAGSIMKGSENKYIREELYQEAFILLLDTIERYDPERGSLAGFFYLRMKGIFGKRFTYEYELAKKHDVIISPIDKELDDDLTIGDLTPDENSEIPYENLLDEDEAKCVRDELFHALDEDELEIVTDYFGLKSKKMTQQDVADKHGLERRDVVAILNRVYKRLQWNNILQDIYLEYESISFINSASIIAYTPTTNRVNSLVERAVIERERVREKHNEKVKELARIELKKEAERQIQEMRKIFNDYANNETADDIISEFKASRKITIKSQTL